MTDSSIGEIFEVEFVENSRQGGVMASIRIDNKVCFPDRRGLQPKVGEIWQVKVSGSNPSGSVYFLSCLKLISTFADRSRSFASKKEVALEEFKRLSILFEHELKDFDISCVNPSITIEGTIFPVVVALEFYEVSVAEIIGNFQIQIKVPGEFNFTYVKKVKISLSWSEVSVVGFHKNSLELASIYFEFRYRNFKSQTVQVFPLLNNQTSFVRFECSDRSVYGVYQVNLPYGKIEELKTVICSIPYVNPDVVKLSLSDVIYNKIHFVSSITPPFTKVEEDFIDSLINPVPVLIDEVIEVSQAKEPVILPQEISENEVEAMENSQVILDNLIQSLIFFRDYKVALTGFRYADNGNSVVLVRGDIGWNIFEFNKETFSVVRRKGAGSNRCVASSLEPREVFRVINQYISFGWNLIEDDDSNEVAGALILSFLPVEVENVLKNEEV